MRIHGQILDIFLVINFEHLCLIFEFFSMCTPTFRRENVFRWTGRLVNIFCTYKLPK